MFIKAFKDCSFRTKEWRELKKWKIYDVDDIQWLLVSRGYRGILEVLPCLMVATKDCLLEGKEYSEWDIISTSMTTYASLRKRVPNLFNFLDEKDEYLEVLKKHDKGLLIDTDEDKDLSKDKTKTDSDEVIEKTEKTDDSKEDKNKSEWILEKAKFWK